MPLTTNERFAASELLIFSKTGVRNDSLAITETTSSFVRDVLVQQHSRWVDVHAKIFQYMLTRGLYLSYSVEQTIQVDLENANTALNMCII